MKNQLKDEELCKWREHFYIICRSYNIEPSAVCVQFGLAAPGVSSVALSDTDPERIKHTIDSNKVQIPKGLWEQLYHEGLISFEGYEMISHRYA